MSIGNWFFQRHQILVSQLGYWIIKPKKNYINRKIDFIYIKILTALQQQTFYSILYPGKFAYFTFDTFEEKAFHLHRVELVVSFGNSMEPEVAWFIFVNSHKHKNCYWLMK